MSDTPNRIVAPVFGDPYKADEARAALRRMAGEGLLELGETALIERRADGNIRVSQETDTVATHKHRGHIAGLVAAAVTGITPLIVAGTIGGKLIGKLRDDGITDTLLKALQKEVQPNTSTHSNKEPLRVRRLRRRYRRKADAVPVQHEANRRGRRLVRCRVPLTVRTLDAPRRLMSRRF